MNPYIYFDPNPLTSFLEKNWKTIRSEFYSLLESVDVLDSENNIEPNQKNLSAQKPNALEGTPEVLYLGSMKAVSVFFRDTLIDKFEKETLNWKPHEKLRIHPYLDRMSFLRSFIYQHKEIIGSCTFNVSHPDTELRHHFGLDPSYLRLHLCLLEDDRCVFDIENHKHVWKEGELFGFDDCNVLHGTRHYPDGQGPRIIMLLDVKKDYLKPYSKTWPCRDYKPKLTELPSLEGWEDRPINLFVNKALYK